MLISTHVLVGGLLGRSWSRRPSSPTTIALAGLSGVASHFGCDALPHWGLGRAAGPRDREFLAVAVPDGLVGLGLLAALAFRSPAESRPVVMAAALGACLPDTDKIARFAVGRSPWPAWVDHWHGRIQRESPHRLPGDIAKAVILAAALLGRSAA